MGTLTQIRQGIIDVLAAADPEALIQDYEQWSLEDEPESILLMFKTIMATQLRAWVFKPIGIREVTRTRACNLVSYAFAFRMIDEIPEGKVTGETWTIVQAVRQAFRDNHTLNGSCFSTKISVGGGEADSGLQLDRLDFIQIDNRKVQYGELMLTAHDLVAG